MNRLNKALKEADEAYKAGTMSEETRDMIAHMTELVNANYRRLMYCKYLVELPPKFIVRLFSGRFKKLHQKYEADKADKDSVAKENDEAIEAVEEGVHGRVCEESESPV